MPGKAFWLPVATLWRRESIRFWREKAGVLGFVGFPLVFWLVVGSGFGNLAFAPLAGARLGLSQLFESTGAIFLISITFTPLGFLIAWRMDSSQGFHAVMNLLPVPLWMLSGASLIVTVASAAVANQKRGRSSA